MPLWIKDPSAILDYSIDWSTWLGEDTITASTWTVGAGLTKGSDTFTTTLATIWLSGGIAETRYAVTNRITTADGRTQDRTRYLHVEEQ